MGVDMWAAELLLRMKEQQAYQDVELCLALPFEGYNADWDDWHRKRMDFIRRYAEKVLVLGEMPSSESYKKRNYYMVEQAGHMIKRKSHICGQAKQHHHRKQQRHSKGDFYHKQDSQFGEYQCTQRNWECKHTVNISIAKP